ncbi:hypothetical protein SR1949_22520 [Sphaerospermopsis reniformis]|jgi:hypothetical protein|uniref:Uncharacterized protein n=1 Tax=Sphaerospermopsis reniformis TaxID=531300 RepID=A0A479ZWY8_9CYAN|nr:hypothetical protein NIES73_16200 [Sphaerospermopsis kisseleviana NIES-73]GCL37145.1 hypothetical protein SR1949_22520 [Sphaerospermopsis reniformis]
MLLYFVFVKYQHLLINHIEFYSVIFSRLGTCTIDNLKFYIQFAKIQPLTWTFIALIS